MDIRLLQCTFDLVEWYKQAFLNSVPMLVVHICVGQLFSRRWWYKQTLANSFPLLVIKTN